MRIRERNAEPPDNPYEWITCDQAIDLIQERTIRQIEVMHWFDYSYVFAWDEESVGHYCISDQLWDQAVRSANSTRPPSKGSFARKERVNWTEEGF